NSRHVAQRDDPAGSIPRFPDTMRKGGAHTARGALEHGDPAAFLLENLVQWKVPPPHHGEDIRDGGEKISCGVRGNRHAIFHGMDQLVAAESAAGSGSEKHGGNVRYTLSHGSPIIDSTRSRSGRTDGRQAGDLDTNVFRWRSSNCSVSPRRLT